MSLSKSDLAKYFDHTLLKADATQDQIDQLCLEAKDYGFYSVCVNPHYIARCKNNLSGTNVHIATVVGFPLGANTTATKVFETKNAIEKGATEIDMVLNIGDLKNQDYELVGEDIKQVVKAAKNIPVKVILETCLLSDEQIIKACQASESAGAAFVKTSTGFSSSGATKEHIALMKKTVGDRLQIKASGGIRDLEKTLQMIEAGANRIGASASVNIINEL